MATLKVSKDEVACISRENITVYKIGNSEKQTYRSERPKAPDPKEKKQPQGNEEGKDLILCSGFSPSGRFFASCDDYKQLTIWLTTVTGSATATDRTAWQKLSTRILIRRPTSLVFTRDESAILVGDKSGDVYSFSTSKLEEEGELRLGHVSMLLDMVLCGDDRFLATCDRDDKIRVSHFPNGYNIQSYCLGHFDFVSCLGYFEDENILISGSGDGSLKLWDYMTGQQLSVTYCTNHIQPYLQPLKHESEIEECMDTTEDSTNSAMQERRDKTDWKTAKAKAAGANQPVNLKCLSCCRKHKTVAVGFDKLPIILLYKLSDVTLTFAQKVVLDDVLWDLCTDSEGRLWTLQAKEGLPLVVYHRTPGDYQMERLSSTAAGSIQTTVQAVNDNWDLLKGSLDQESIFSVLHKVKMDNIAIYQQQKEQKLKEQQIRYKEKQERRKRNKQAVPPGECQHSQPGNNDTGVLTPSECSESDSDNDDTNNEVPKKIKVADSL